MNILVCGDQFFDYPTSVANAFRRLDHSVDVVTYDVWGGPLRKGADRIEDLVRDARQARMKRNQRGIVEMSRTGRYDFVLLLNPTMVTPELHEAATVLVWLVDDIHRWGFDIELMRGARLVASYSKPDSERLLQSGLSAIYLPMAFDDGLRPEWTAASPHPVFVGAKYPVRENLIRAALDAGVRIDAFGNGWSTAWRDRVREFDFKPRIPFGHPAVSRSQAFGLFKGATAAINVHSGPSSGINPRTFEICGSEGLQVMDRSDVADLLEPERELLIAPDGGEGFVGLLVEIQASPGDRKWAAIRRRGRDAVVAKHTFVDRCRSLLASI